MTVNFSCINALLILILPFFKLFYLQKIREVKMTRKTLAALSLLCMFIFGLQAQTPITIGTDNTTDFKLPIFCQQNYSYSQSIYLKSEIGSAVTLSKIAFQYTGSSWTQNLKIYLGNTAKNEFISAYPNRDWVSLSSMTQVFDGSVTANAGWVEITLSTPFAYDGIGNLVVAVDENSEYASEDGDDFYNSQMNTRRSMIRVGDSDIDPSDSQMSGSAYKAIANIQLFPQSPTPVLMVTPTTVDFPATPTDAPFRMSKISITNFGAGVLSVNSRSDIALTGDGATSYSLIDSLNFPLNLASGQNAYFYAKFTPAASGAKNASISITTQGDKGVHNDCVTLSGLAYAPYKTEGTDGGIAYSESFDSYLATDGAFYNEWYLEWGCSEIAYHSGSKSIYVPGGYTLGAVTPRMDIAATDSLSFFLQRNEAATNSSVRVAFTEAANPLTNTYTNLITYNLADVPVLFTDAQSRKSISLAPCAGKKVYIAFIGSSTTSSTRMDDVTFFSSNTAIENSPLVSETLLKQNYPNPFNPATTISFYNNLPSNVKLTVLNAKGEIVSQLVNAKLAAGNHHYNFNGAALNSGLYFYKLETPDAVITKKMLLVK